MSFQYFLSFFPPELPQPIAMKANDPGITVQISFHQFLSNVMFMDVQVLELGEATEITHIRGSHQPQVSCCALSAVHRMLLFMGDKSQSVTPRVRGEFTPTKTKKAESLAHRFSERKS